MMVLTPNRALTLVFSGIGHAVLRRISSPSSTTPAKPPSAMSLYPVRPRASSFPRTAPPPTLPFPPQGDGQSPGIVEAISLSSGASPDRSTFPRSAIFRIDNTGNRFSASATTPTRSASSRRQISEYPAAMPVTSVTVPASTIQSGAFFSTDDTTAYVLNCGAECGGTAGQHTEARFNAYETCRRSLSARQRSRCNRGICSIRLDHVSRWHAVYRRGVPSLALHRTDHAATTCGLLAHFDLST